MRTLSALFRNTLFVAGITLVALGLGNTLVAHFKVREYQSAPGPHTPSCCGRANVRKECQAVPLLE